MYVIAADEGSGIVVCTVRQIMPSYAITEYRHFFAPDVPQAIACLMMYALKRLESLVPAVDNLLGRCGHGLSARERCHVEQDAGANRSLTPDQFLLSVLIKRRVTVSTILSLFVVSFMCASLFDDSNAGENRPFLLDYIPF